MLDGGAGQDLFRFTEAQSTDLDFDKIADFAVADDTVQLDLAILLELSGPGVIDSDFFTIGTVAADADDYLVYNPVNGALLYD